LPAKHTTTLLVPWQNKDEEKIYAKLEAYCAQTFDMYKASGSVQKRMIVLLSLVKDLQMACSGGILPHRLVEIANSDEAAIAMKAARAVERGDAEEGAENECPICLQLVEDPYLTACNHQFCKECLTSFIGARNEPRECPLCRDPVSLATIRAKPASAEEQAAAAAGAAAAAAASAAAVKPMSSKLDRLVAELNRIKNSDCTSCTPLGPSRCTQCSPHPDFPPLHTHPPPHTLAATAKCLVFSQFKQTLDWLQIELPKRNFTFRTLLGSMTKNERSKSLAAFQNDPPTTIFLLSMRAGAVGVNLTQVPSPTQTPRDAPTVV